MGLCLLSRGICEISISQRELCTQMEKDRIQIQAASLAL